MNPVPSYDGRHRRAKAHRYGRPSSLSVTEMIGHVMVASGLATANDWERRIVRDPELAAYVRTELGGDFSRIAVRRPPAKPRGRLRTRLRYWLNSFRGFGILDLRRDRA